MLLALTLIFISITMLVPSVEIVIQNGEIQALHEKVNATELISFHTEMVSYCNNNSLECNKDSFINFDNEGNYGKFLIPELSSSSMRKKIHCYAEGSRYFTELDQNENTPESQVEYNQLFNALNQYSPSYMGIGKVNKSSWNKSTIIFWNGTKMDITGSQVSRVMKNGDIVMVS